MAVLGLGFMGSTHLQALRRIAGARLAAVFDFDEARLSGDLSSVQGNIGGAGGKLDFSSVGRYRDLEPLLADPQVDAVDICLPTHHHADVATRALRAGKHVLVEKPMALDGASADRMADEADRSKRILMTAHVLRFWPAYAALRDAVRQGKLGAARCATLRRRCAAPGWGGWLLDPAKSGGGAFDLLIHDVDMALHVFGKPEAVAATGSVDESAGIDCLNAQLYYPDGCVVSILGGWHNRGKFPFSMEYTVTFDGGTIDFSSAGRPATLFAADGTERVLAAADADAYAAELDYFIACCRDGRSPEACPPRESADAVKLMLRILEARSRRGEKIPCRI